MTDQAGDSDQIDVCPLCCEELDLSDREFYPCKCGYQVCMWCWHRIRETESGLCPACRTPYGEDPHQFTALDVEEVLKANKAQAAARKEKEKDKDKDRYSHSHSHQHHHQQHSHHLHHLHHLHHSHSNSSASSALASSAILHAATMHASTTSNNTAAASASSTSISATAIAADRDHDNQSTNSTDTPKDKDKSQLAIMRVIRRNLVYTVGLPPKLAAEDILRKPEYFGQYGKIAKIVLNRSQVTADGPESRRSASAYVTFQYKQDALTCILALDGFFFENRNIRASFGTSKYCSAFIKNVRCSNPECTYLHELGAPEDTFTKQEIQAGYVTSGKDVLARQQQIMEEQLQLAGVNSGSGARKRIGGGGPSGSGRASANPVFPPPEYDESLRIQSELAAAAAATATAARPVVAKRASTSQVAVVPAVNPAAALRGKINRSSSVGTTVRTTSAASVPVPPPVPTGPRKTASNSSLSAGISAASVVAGVRPAAKEPAENTHSTLTTLTPLVKRAAAAATTKTAVTSAATAATTATPTIAKPLIENSKLTSNGRSIPGVLQPQDTASLIRPGESALIGGSVIGPRTVPSSNSLASYGDSLLSPSDPIYTERRSSNAYLGYVISTAGRGTPPAAGPPMPNSNTALIGGTILPTGTGLSSAAAAPSKSSTANGTMDAGIIGFRPSSSASTSGSNAPNNGSSELASLLGINLPTGNGSLEGWWGSSNGMSTAPSPLAALNGQPHLDPPLIPSMRYGGSSNSNSSGSVSQHLMSNGGLIGGVPIGGRNPIAGPPRPVANGSINYDMAVLQSLLPNVNVTSESSLAGGTPNWLTGAVIGGEPISSWNNNGASGGGAAMANLQQPAQAQTHGTIGGGQRTAQSSRLW